MGQQTMELADMCFDLETKDGLLEDVRHVLMTTTMTRRDEGNKEIKEEGSDRRVDTKEGKQNDRRVENTMEKESDRRVETKNSRRADGTMGTKINRRVDDTMELKNGRRAEGKMETKIDRRVESKSGRRADYTEIEVIRRVDHKLGATRIIRRVDENGNDTSMTTGMTSTQWRLAVFLAVLTITILGCIKLPTGRASLIYPDGYAAG